MLLFFRCVKFHVHIFLLISSILFQLFFVVVRALLEVRFVVTNGDFRVKITHFLFYSQVLLFSI